MKTFDLSTFMNKIDEELREFEEMQSMHFSNSQKTMEQWINTFLVFSGYEEEEDDFALDDYEEESLYSQDFEYQELVNRRKYRSFRDDDRY